jgi:hypothetical protein
MKISIFFILLICASYTQAQTIQKTSISGAVNAMRPVYDAHCYLKNNQYFGSVTDTLGFFHFGFPPALLYDTLVISAIGFEKREVPLSSLALGQDTIHFYLEQQTILLREVLIKSEGYDLKNIVLEAVANIPNNFPNKPHQLKGLYRKISTEGSMFTHLEEAVITIEDKSYKTSPSSVKISTEYFRETKDWGNIDSFAVKVFDKMHTKLSEQLNTSINPLNRLCLSNSIRYFNQETTIFNFKSMQKYINDYYKFELMDVSIANGDTILHIAFAAGVTPPPPKHVSGRNYLKINMKDMAIVEIQFGPNFKDRPLLGLGKVIFQKQHGKYYPKYIETTTGRFINTSFDNHEYDIHTFWFDEVNLDFKKIRPREVNDPNGLYNHKRKGLNSEYWNKSPLIRKYPLEQGVKNDLERRQPLEDQFKEANQK